MAIDLQPMAPLEGVIQLQGDITSARTAEMVQDYYFANITRFLREAWKCCMHRPNSLHMDVGK